MPYDNVPKELWDDMDSCVEQVQAEQDVSKERAVATCYDSVVSNKARTLTMSITRAQRMSDGRVRWRARANSGEVDSRNEKCDISLFNDFADNFWEDQEKLSKGKSLDHPPTQLDIAHYSFYLPQDQRAKARVGWPIKIWTDGQALMMQGFFDETRLGQAAANSVLNDEDDRIKVSIGFYPDWDESGVEDGVFTYRGGRGRARLDHLALTAHPVDLEAEIVAGGMEMSDELTLKQDAQDVLGDEELVEELEGLRAEAKSTVPDGAVVKGEEDAEESEDKSKPEPEGIDKAKTKTVSGREHVKSDFLVVEDADKVSTWHLPVKVKGEPNHRLMGAAWAALHEGYRGNKYEGPDKQEAISKLKALYESEGMELPSKEDAEVEELKSNLDDKIISVVAEALRANFLPKLSEAIDQKMEPVAELNSRVDELEQQVKALAEDEGQKVKAALDSDDGDWLYQMLSNSAQHKNVVKGDDKGPDPEVAADSDFARQFGNPQD